MFVPLDTKTVYSFLDSLIDLPTYISTAKALGYQSIGIMDKENLYAAYHFIRQTEAAGLQPILGIEVQQAIAGLELPIYLIARNTAGYKILLKYSSQRLTDDVVPDLPETDDVAVVVPYQEGIEKLDLPHHAFIGVFLDSPQKVFNRPLLALQTVRYFREEETQELRVLHAIRDNLPLRDIPQPTSHQLLYPAEQMTEQFRQRFPEALENLEHLVTGIDYQFDTALKLPRFNRNRPAHEELRDRSEQGLRSKNLWQPLYCNRLDEELSVIHDMGFDDYFLIVWDLLRFGRHQGYYMGMGRGSAAGSLVAYALDITGIDPVANHLLFERFLNRERYSMPDIDIDLPDLYRSEFLRYVRDRYGSQHTAQIVTFSTFGAKQAIRDVFKRFGTPEYELTNITKKIGFRDTLASAYENNISFRQLINSKPEYQKAFAIAKRIEGQPRQTSIHAAGIVMSDDELTDHIPLKNGEEMFITQYDAPAIEANGLLKMDFLGLRNLTFVQKMAEKVKEETGVTIDIAAIDLEDSATLALFAQGRTKGIFQFEQAGAISLLKRIRPRRFEDVVATTSLNRPGASDYIDNFIKRREGREAVDLIDDVVAPILAPTYGIMLYQEQVMQIAQAYAGFSLGKADLLRRAMSKKDKAEMDKMEAEFLQGAATLGRNLDTAKRLYQMMAKFAGYGFNRSHAFAYSALAFQLCYFKAHYPAVFYDVMLNYSNADYIDDALAAGFQLGRLSINTVPYYDKIAEQTITLGLRHLRAVPRELAYWILESRASQPFESIEDFITRLPVKYHKTELLEPMVQVGLFDQFDRNRRKIISNLSHLFTFVTELGSLFSDSSYSWLTAEDYSPSEKYQLEIDLLGVGISPHPLVTISKQEQGNFIPLSELVVNSQATILVQLMRLRVIRTKTNGQQMAFATVTDTKQQLDVTLFPETYQLYQQQLVEGQIYLMTGRLQERNGNLQMILSQLHQPVTEKCWIQLSNHDQDKAILAVLTEHPGNYPVVLHYEDTKKTLQLKQPRVQKTLALIEELKPLVMKTIFR
ncbi:DNA polymerase III subunit alpha [Streptococcus entericus]|uniref:DNA polymerase III subunit alpha n=1 Tax=Streptococcus entericus TaxID=155680 RepID=UPI000367DD03|nr:DNA polymerase III subunit alpha [Streptococcus entericus]